MLKAFRLTPITAADEACRVLAAEPGILGRDWELLGAREEAGELLCRTPAGELVLVVTAPLADAALLARGLATLGRLRRALPLAPLLGGKGLRKVGESRLLLLGGRVEEGIPAAAGAGVEVKLLGTVVGQPGPPLLLYDLPLAAPAEAPAGKPAATGAGPERTPFPLGDAEIDRILSDRDLEVEHGDKDRR